MIVQPNGECLKRDCDKFRNVPNNFNKQFEIKITIADHSSMLKDVRCRARPLEKFLGLTVNIEYLKYLKIIS
jgi:hypothetical protein